MYHLNKIKIKIHYCFLNDKTDLSLNDFIKNDNQD